MAELHWCMCLTWYGTELNQFSNTSRQRNTKWLDPATVAIHVNQPLMPLDHIKFLTQLATQADTATAQQQHSSNIAF